MGLFDEVLDKVGEPYTGGKGFEYGTHDVIIGTAEAKKDAKDRELIEVVVFDPEDNDRKATCTLWFHTDGAAKMAVTKVLGLLVHKVDDDKKDKVRDLGKQLFGKIDDPVKARDVANTLINDKLLGEKAFLVAEPQGKYKTTSYGDLWHYAAEPKSKPVDVVATVDGDEDSIDAADIPDFDKNIAEDL